MSERNEAGMQAEFWNEAGGRMWVDNITQTHALLQPLGDELMLAAAPRAGEAVLDIGCGGGLNSLEIANAVGKSGYVRAVDVSSVALAVKPGYPTTWNSHVTTLRSKTMATHALIFCFPASGSCFSMIPKLRLPT